MSQNQSPYVLQTTDGTSCPRCRRRPRMLVHEDGLIDKRHPAFYVCRCGFVGQVGVGPVRATPMVVQADYDELVIVMGPVPTDRSSPEAHELHRRIMRVLDGQDPDPRFVDVGK